MGITQQRKTGERSIKNIALQKGLSTDQVVFSLLSASAEALTRYVISRNETPLTDIKKLIIQASLLRYNEINHVAQLQSMPEELALQSLEAAEDELNYTNSPDYVLPADVSAAINLILEQKRGEKLKGAGQFFNRSKRFNGFTQTNSEPWLGGDEQTTTGSTGGTWASIGNIANATGSIFDAFNKVVDSVNKVKTDTSGAPKSVGDVIEEQLAKLKGVGSDIGKDSIDKSLKENLPAILGILAVVVIIIVIAIYATRRK